ncbi:ABC transporter permease [Euzebyella marina]|uniref:ABC transporter permease n=1 Tax=Euzebyella marina TaxID=1761453 RepID=A0A3G2L641_9FLAO|nr:ABC transporter permease [Euzebyella marina]AYN67706.1 ABC transporter permease [Euzebyella marina]MBG49663.1 nitrate ABC transporter permease [Pseudozobellia sp.]|tara:strand:+ start:129426 stop:130523 length:1098 start_codon:yes stop_codon:yes gene_type:complete
MKQSLVLNKVSDLVGTKSIFGKFKIGSFKFDGNKILRKFLIPALSILLFVGLWHTGSKALFQMEADYKIEKALTDQGREAAEAMQACIASGDVSCQPNTLPSPSQVWQSLQSLIADHKVISADKKAFAEKTAGINAKREAEGKAPITYTGRPSFVDQIFTSLKTVFAGFLLALIIAVPIGIVIGLSPVLRSSFNWLIQIFKPVSPVVWLLLVFMIVKTMTKDSNSDSAFIISFISVGLCAMWATLVNTAMGVSSVDKDYINVAKVLKLRPLQKVFKVILPSSLPLIFTGLRITLSVAWMVLIAIELLAQSPGLGSFVWEEFQNGAIDSNSKIIVAMFVIGIIGFLLDRLMLTIQNMVSFNKNDAI